MVWLPTLSADTARVALPLVSVAVTGVLVSTWIVTCPLGAIVPGATAATWIVNVTVWPQKAPVGAGALDVIVVVVLAATTACVKDCGVAVALKLASPL